MKRLLLVTAMASACVLANFLGSKAQAAMEPHFTAKIYDLKDRSKHMFDYKSEIEILGDTKTIHNTVTDLNGAILVTEKTVVTAGKLASFEQDQKQLGTVGKIEVKDGKANFTFTRDGKTKTDDEKIDDDFIVTSTLVAYLQANWDKIAKGETVKSRLGVLDRLETVGFQFKKESDKEIGGAAGVVLKMKASSLVISALVNPLFFGFTADGSKLLELEGRTNVKLMVDGKLKDFDGYTVYSYPAAKIEAPAVPIPEKKTPAKKATKKK